VNHKQFHKLIRTFLQLNYSVARIGDKKQREIPTYTGFYDFKDRELNLRNDVSLINNSRLFLSTDSSIWPIAAGLGKKMLLTNVASIYQPFRTHRKLFHRIFFGPRKIFVSKADTLPINEKIISWLDPKAQVVLKKKLLLLGLFKFRLLLIRDNYYSEIIRISLNMLR
jgi:hypothetical protein